MEASIIFSSSLQLCSSSSYISSLESAGDLGGAGEAALAFLAVDLAAVLKRVLKGKLQGKLKEEGKE